ncbi:MAG: peptidase [Proteobacteria bacterium]|nr:peptidase [Pseudomonadota bacterium]
MIKSFRHRGLENFFYDGSKKGIQPNHTEKIAYILDLLDSANTIQVMNFPGSKLHKLNPKQDGIWAVTVSANWRITFKFIKGDVFIVDYKDYH